MQAKTGIHRGTGEKCRHNRQHGAGYRCIHTCALAQDGRAAIDECQYTALAKRGVDRLPIGQRSKSGCTGDDSRQRQRALTSGTKVTHKAGIGFPVELLRGGA